ncbi:sulfite exporter TauE/SafE family protein [Alcaligenes phenolicus]|uniref:sulfite exporter TauE/SafE family protein n=1 Tax=Alcaligenes phenolicus TaxID=232846 RepID=UPI002B5AA866|nr:sulfite exporter TauE/SafE family protein [Alcaligenes phenolicus]HRO20168.1 sulfite exporter TauE/SafE family protein [Alcaligenes phenolicus]HRP13863.1 sulfite exporter TauE/SafE family protein [Alcaligenes phenolicus]
MAALIDLVDPLSWLLMALLVVLAAFLQGVGGVGFAMLVAPIAALIFPQLVPGPLLALGGSVSLLAALRERQHIVPDVVVCALGGRATGSIIAILAMTQLPIEAVNLGFALAILAAVALSAWGLRILPSKRNMILAGIASGIMGTLTSVGAPALAIAIQNLAPAQLRASLGLILFLGASLSLILLVVAGLFSWQQAMLSIVLYPFMLLGFALSGRWRHKVSMPLMRRLLLGICSLSAVVLIARSV